MSEINLKYHLVPDIQLGKRINENVPEADQRRQRLEAKEILRRLNSQPGVILADEVGMGKTFVALAVAYSTSLCRNCGPVIIMAPSNLIDKWEQDLKTFCELYVRDRIPLNKKKANLKDLRSRRALRYGIARHSIELLKFLDDTKREECHLIFLAQGAMSRQQGDKWVRLALISKALRLHGRGGASRLIHVKKHIHRFLGELIWAKGEQRAHRLGEELWKQMIWRAPEQWKRIYNRSVKDPRYQLDDDPVPADIINVLDEVNLKELAKALENMPVRARGGDRRITERITKVRRILLGIESELWKILIMKTRWRSPLLVMDEAHHLKNPKTALARQLQSPDSDNDLRIGDGAMSKAFDRMVFLTATPFQLGHHELVRVLERFGDVRWNKKELGDSDNFYGKMRRLCDDLDYSQRKAITLQRNWARLKPEEDATYSDDWWEALLNEPRETLTYHQRAVLDAFDNAQKYKTVAEKNLKPWIVRHNKGTYWSQTTIQRRNKFAGASITDAENDKGLFIPSDQILPFFLAARSAANPGKDLLGEALCSSFDAFRFTRKNRLEERDQLDDPMEDVVDPSFSKWYLKEFDQALRHTKTSSHPKISVTVQKVVDLWESGEKVLVFAFYRRTCRALRIQISQEIEKRMFLFGQKRLGYRQSENKRVEIEQLLDRIQNRFFDRANTPGRQATDSAIQEIIDGHKGALDKTNMSMQDREQLTDVMRRFLRVPTTLLRSFPLAELDSISNDQAIQITLDAKDGSNLSWRKKLNHFLEFLTLRCSEEERKSYLEAANRMQTGGIRVETDEEIAGDEDESIILLANVQQATGITRRDARTRLMRAFNTPFFPDILVCSEVMGEGVDLQRYCRHVIHHDLAWNPSTIEQRTGRIDRLGCKAEGEHPIHIYMPFIDGAADERQYRVMSDREKWFRIVMGQDEVARLITEDSTSEVPVPEAISGTLCFKLGIV